MDVQIVRAFDFQIAVPVGDWMLQDIVRGGVYEPYVVAPFQERIHQGSVVLDIGANIGIFTIAAARTAARV
ncbi:MAG TPA: hypothetical protein VII49_10225, partial [Rhizomicrobium sp.]